MPQLQQTRPHSNHLLIIEKERQLGRHNLKKPGLGTKYVTTTHDQEPDPEEDVDNESLPLYMVGGGATPPVKVPLLVDGKSLTMELDTGAAITIVSEKQYKGLFSHLPLKESQALLKTYSGEQLPVVSDVMLLFESSMSSKYRNWGSQL